MNYMKLARMSLMCATAFTVPAVYFTSAKSYPIKILNDRGYFIVSKQDHDLLEEEKRRFEFRDSLESKYGEYIDARIIKFLKSHRDGNTDKTFRGYSLRKYHDTFMMYEIFWLYYEVDDYVKFNPDAVAAIEKHVENLIIKRLDKLAELGLQCYVDVSSEEPVYGKTRVAVGIGFGTIFSLMKSLHGSNEKFNKHIDSIICSYEQISKC